MGIVTTLPRLVWMVSSWDFPWMNPMNLTRLIRESYRLSEEHFRCGIDIVVIARTSAKGRNYHEIESALIHLGKLHKIYKTV